MAPSLEIMSSLCSVVIILSKEHGPREVERKEEREDMELMIDAKLYGMRGWGERRMRRPKSSVRKRFMGKKNIEQIIVSYK